MELNLLRFDRMLSTIAPECWNVPPRRQSSRDSPRPLPGNFYYSREHEEKMSWKLGPLGSCLSLPSIVARAAISRMSRLIKFYGVFMT